MSSAAADDDDSDEDDGREETSTHDSAPDSTLVSDLRSVKVPSSLQRAPQRTELVNSRPPRTGRSLTFGAHSRHMTDCG